MTDPAWLLNNTGDSRWSRLRTDADRCRLSKDFDIQINNDVYDEIAGAEVFYELQMMELLDQQTNSCSLRKVAEETFQIARALPIPDNPLPALKWLVRLGCTAYLGDRFSDFRRIVKKYQTPDDLLNSTDWGIRVWSTVLDVWIRLLRKNGWEDLNLVQQNIHSIRGDQGEFEPSYLKIAESNLDARPAWELVAYYHLAKAAEVLGEYIGIGSANGTYDIREQLDSQFDRAINATKRGYLLEEHSFSRLLARTAESLVSNSIWTVTRAINSKVSRFVRHLTSTERPNPIFETLPPQKRTLADKGLLGTNRRSVVVSLPTSSGKTLIAQFRILQALNQFDYENGWVAYLAPTRALVNQLCSRLRQDFMCLNIRVEKVSSALGLDSVEEDLFTESDRNHQFRVLVTTPEKLDLLIRGGWERKMDRPLSLVVVDEAHNLASADRGIRLELLLATINRECVYAQFLLLTPFIPNGEEIAKWLSPESCDFVDASIDWIPNDRVIAIARASKGSKRGDFDLYLHTVHTSGKTLHIPDNFSNAGSQSLGIPWHKVNRSPGKLAAVTAQMLRNRGAVIVLANTAGNAWKIAESFKVEECRRSLLNEDIAHIRNFLVDEMGQGFPLANLLEYGVGVHHTGISDDARALVEWLTVHEKLDVLVATTTIAQGMNFPVSGVVFASHQYPSSTAPYSMEMPSQDFWNIAGRAGRVDHGDIGVVSLVANSQERFDSLKAFVNRSVGELNSTLIEMVQSLSDASSLLQLEKLSYMPNWSSFVQYLAHTYRQMGNHELFASQAENVLRGMLGFQSLEKSHADWTDNLIRGVQRYAERMAGQPLSLVDATGFSLESVNGVFGRLNDLNISSETWSAELFSRNNEHLRRMMGLLLQVPELRKSLEAVTGGSGPNGDKLASIVSSWVQGQSLTDMANEFFGDANATNGDEKSADSTKAMTDCCRSLFGRLTQTASWGLSALQSLTIGKELDTLSPDERRSLRNLPARVYYGVNSDEAIALRLLGVPRTAAQKLAMALGVDSSKPLHRIRSDLYQAGEQVWTKAMGDRGASYHRVWTIIEGNY